MTLLYVHVDIFHGVCYLYCNRVRFSLHTFMFPSAVLLTPVSKWPDCIPLTASFRLSAVRRTEKMIELELGMAVINNWRFATITIPYPDPLWVVYTQNCLFTKSVYELITFVDFCSRVPFVCYLPPNNSDRGQFGVLKSLYGGLRS